MAKKGQPGYIKVRKMKYLVWSVGEFAVVLGLLILGYAKTGSKLNLLTAAAVVGCLPASKMLVEYITMAPHKSVSPDICEELKEKAPLLVTCYDLIITSTEKVMPVAAVVIYGHTVCGYTKSDKTDEAECASYIKEMLKNNGYQKMTVKVFKDYKSFLLRAEGMNNIAAVEKETDRRKDKAVRDLILTLSM
ncbi:hypothetical protein AALA78_04065 [Lachnospiraceae bacterium 42-17]|jgi:hypothetical protein|nr:hypothetical protein [Dorea sp.]